MRLRKLLLQNLENVLENYSKKLKILLLKQKRALKIKARVKMVLTKHISMRLEKKKQGWFNIKPTQPWAIKTKKLKLNLKEY